MFNSYSITTFGDFGTGKSLITANAVYNFYVKNPDTIVISNCWFNFPHVRFNTHEELATILSYVKYNHLNHTVSSIAPDEYLELIGVEAMDSKVVSYIVYIDEISLFFNSRDFAKNFKDKALLEMLVQPRKYSMKMFFIAQSVDMIDKFVRELTLEILEVRYFLFGLFRKVYSYDRQQFFKQESFDRTILDVKGTKFFNFLPYVFFPYLKRFFTWVRLPKIANLFFIKPLYFSQEILGLGSLKYVKNRSISRMIKARGGVIPTDEVIQDIKTEYRSSDEVLKEAGLSSSPFPSSSF